MLLVLVPGRRAPEHVQQPGLGAFLGRARLGQDRGRERLASLRIVVPDQIARHLGPDLTGERRIGRRVSEQPERLVQRLRAAVNRGGQLALAGDVQQQARVRGDYVRGQPAGEPGQLGQAQPLGVLRAHRGQQRGGVAWLASPDEQVGREVGAAVVGIPGGRRREHLRPRRGARHEQVLHRPDELQPASAGGLQRQPGPADQREQAADTSRAGCDLLVE